MMRRVHKEVPGRRVTLCWAIWKSQNDLIWQQRKRRVENVVSYATLCLNQWLYAQRGGQNSLFKYVTFR